MEHALDLVWRPERVELARKRVDGRAQAEQRPQVEQRLELRADRA
jgi:hypothetical protein